MDERFVSEGKSSERKTEIRERKHVCLVCCLPNCVVGWQLA